MKKKWKEPVLILIKDSTYGIGEVRCSFIEEKDTLKWAEYWYLRRIEKEGWYADEVYIVEASSKLPIEEWLGKEEERQEKAEDEIRKLREIKELKRLKEKYESKESSKSSKG